MLTCRSFANVSSEDFETYSSSSLIPIPYHLRLIKENTTGRASSGSACSRPSCGGSASCRRERGSRPARCSPTCNAPLSAAMAWTSNRLRDAPLVGRMVQLQTVEKTALADALFSKCTALHSSPRDRSSAVSGTVSAAAAQRPVC